MLLTVLNTERLDLSHKSHVFTLPLPHQFPPNVVRLYLHHSSYRDFQRTPSLYSPSEKAQTKKICILFPTWGLKS